MNKKQLIEEWAAQTGQPFSIAEQRFNKLIRIIYSCVANDEEVNISGFGKFLISHREARIGVNPKNPSQKITIPKLNTPKFKAGEAFKAAVAIK